MYFRKLRRSPRRVDLPIAHTKRNRAAQSLLRLRAVTSMRIASGAGANWRGKRRTTGKVLRSGALAINRPGAFIRRSSVNHTERKDVGLSSWESRALNSHTDRFCRKEYFIFVTKPAKAFARIDCPTHLDAAGCYRWRHRCGTPCWLHRRHGRQGP